MRIAIGALVATAVLLAACGERAQTASHRKSDTRAYEGAATAEFSASGWKAGDEKSWEQQIRNRAQGQNEYSRAAAP